MRTSSIALVVSVVAVVGGPGAAAAEEAGAPPPRFRYGDHLLGERGFVFVDHPDATVPEPGVAHVPPARILYLNDCKPGGCTIRPGQLDDSRLDQSSIVRMTGHLSPFEGTDVTWQAIVACVRENYAPFTIEVVTTDPGNVPHFEAYAAGHPSNVGMPGGIAGVASFSCGIIPNAVSFSFLNLFPDDVDEACWTISQESGHNFGLSHSMLSTDAMTYLPFPRRKRFVDEAACIGTQGCCQPTEECRCELTLQNSVERLTQTFGRIGATPPDIIIETPGHTASVTPGFLVRASVTDWDGVSLVELLIDDVPIGELTTPPFEFRAPDTLAAGEHEVAIRATDGNGLVGEVAEMVTLRVPCTSDLACDAATPGTVCGTDGRCVPAPPPDDGGCATGSEPPRAPLAAGLLLAIVVRRRRRG